MFHPVFFCLCLWRLDGVFGDSVSVKEGHSVTLNSDLTEIMDDDLIQWMFGYKRIAQMCVTDDRITENYVHDGRFRDRLKLDKRTGSLTITNTRPEHTGRYELQTNCMRKSFNLTVQHCSSCMFGAPDDISHMEGWSLYLTTGSTKDDDVIQWRFLPENTLIAEINKRAKSFTVYDDVLDGRFRDRLKLDNQTGTLTITKSTTKLTGVYEQQTNSMRKSYIYTVNSYLPGPDISCPSSSSSSSSSSESHPNHQHTCSDSVHCCGPTEAVIQLVLSALVGVATVIILVYDIRSRRAEQDQAGSPTSKT